MVPKRFSEPNYAYIKIQGRRRAYGVKYEIQ